jgi:exodeoxyribonuclease-5
MPDGALLWSPQQKAALGKIEIWSAEYHVTGQQIFRFAGYAGTGKTTLARHALATTLWDRPAYMAYTAQAARVMRQNGCAGARNIHQWLYKSRSRPRSAVCERIKITKEKGALPVAAATEKELTFDRRPSDDLFDANIVIVDEASMVDDTIAADLEALDKPILAIYDPAQLPPINKDNGPPRGSLSVGDPDVFLTEIHRQAEGDPIIAMSMRARQGLPIGHADYGDRCFVRRLTLELIASSNADQILCGRNETRRTLNDMIRRRRGYCDPLPEVGERLVVLRNRHDDRLYNGGIVTVLSIANGIGVNTGKPVIILTVRPDGENRVVDDVRVYNDDFFAEFDFGYCLTVHKAQGSQWDSVMLVDEHRSFRKSGTHYRWLYTGITRARSRLCVARLPR